MVNKFAITESDIEMGNSPRDNCIALKLMKAVKIWTVTLNSVYKCNKHNNFCKLLSCA